MTIYENSDQLYACAQALFERIQQEDPEAADAVAAAKLLIRFRCSQPTAEILINGRRQPVQVSYGRNNVRPEVDVEVPADTLHRILLGQLSLPKALASKAMKVRGPAWKTLTLGDLFRQSQDLYPHVLEEQGVPMK